MIPLDVATLPKHVVHEVMFQKPGRDQRPIERHRGERRVEVVGIERKRHHYEMKRDGIDLL